MDVSFNNVLEGARQYFQGLPSSNKTAGPYFQHQQSVPQRQPNDQQHHGTPSPGTPNQHWQQHSTTPDPNRSQSREQVPVQRPPSVSRPPSHPSQYQDTPRQYHAGYVPERQNVPSPQLGFQFTRPQSRETPTHQYQPHIATSSPYHHHQPDAPQVSRAPSRESISGQSYQPTYQAASQYSYPPRSYPLLPPKTTTSYTSTQYQTTSQSGYYKQKSYPTATPAISSQPSLYAGDSRTLSGNVQSYQNSTSTEQTYRRTHNLPPIAELSNYHSSRNVKDPNKVTLPRARLPSSSSYSHVTSSAPVQQSVSKRDIYSNSNSNATYNHYRAPVSQHTKQQITPQVSTQPGYSYSNVIMTLANTSHYTTTSSQQATASGFYNRPKTEVPTIPRRQIDSVAANYNRANVINEPTTVIKQKRESPLDLSVKTVRTSADSTEEGESNSNGKHGQNKTSNSSLSSHSYPTLDINTIQRNFTNRSQPATVTAPKVEFQPNFNLPRHSGWPSSSKTVEDPLRKTIYESSADFRQDFRQMNYKEPIKTHYQNGHVPTVTTLPVQLPKSTSVRSEYSPKTLSNVNPYENHDVKPLKRSADISQQSIPNKIPKVENWRQSIDFQIEQKLSDYKQQQMLAQHHHHPSASSTPTSVISQTYSEPKHQLTQPYNKQTSTIRPVPIATGESVQTNHQYPGYMAGSIKSSSHVYLNQGSRSNHNALIPTTSRQPNAGAVDKRVLNLLRNSIEVKEQKKLEQQKSHEVVTQRSDVQQPSTDVKAPFQPKPGIDRNNVSPVPPTSVQEIKELVATANNVMNGSSSEITYLDAFLEIRVRTKGELKQLHSENNNSSSDAISQALIDPMKSPQKPTIQHVSSSSSTTSGSTSPPKLVKERQLAVAPRKRLFSRNEDDSTKNGVPARDKSGLRSSSETSIFDFPDSDDDNEMPVLERQSLDAMRRDRRNSLKPTGAILNITEVETKTEPVSPPESQEEDIFGSICDTFVEQMKKTPMKRVKRRTEQEPDSEIQVKQEETLEIITVKTEPEPEPEHVEKCAEIVQVGETKCEEKISEVIQENNKTPILANVIKTDTDSESEIKKDDRIAVRNKRRVRRKVLSSSDSSDNEEEETEEKKPDFKELEAKLEEASKSLNDMKSENDTIDKSVEVKTEKLEPSETKILEENADLRRTSTDSISMVRPAKKPLFGDGSDFYPGWEEEVYNYKKSLRMPPSLIQVTRPPTAMRLSTSLPDLDPCPQSPTPSVMTDNDKESALKRSLKKFKSEPIDSDSESTSIFNVFSKKTNYDSEGSSSIKSLPNTKQENQSILDRLLEKCGGKKKRKLKRKEDHSPKLIPKAENPIELLPTPTPGLQPSEKSPEKSKGLTVPVINAKSAVLPFRKDTVKTFKDAFINSGSSILGGHDKFTTIVLKSRTRKETRAMKQRATIKEVFGEDRPASAPPVTCVNDVEIKNDLQNLEPFSKTLEEILIKKESENIVPAKTNIDIKRIMKEKLNNTDNSNLLKELANRRIKEEILEEDDDEDENKRLIEFIKRDSDARSETASLDGDDRNLSSKRRSKFGKIRRKFSSGFDYIRKKKKVKKEEPEVERKKRIVAKTPESIDDIQKEIKSWVLNKGIGETHLHRAARLGYADITAYCLEKMDCPPSPRDNAGYTPLHEACVKGHLEIAKLLLQYGANVHESAQGGIRPLHEAVENGFVEIVRLLLSYGADPALATYAGVTPLSLATDENTRKLLKSHLIDKSGEHGGPWQFNGPATCFDPEESGYNILDEAPRIDSDSELEDIEVDMSETLPPNLYTLRGEPRTERWVLLQDLSNQLKIKSRDALLRQIAPPNLPNAPVNYKSVLRELKMSDFLEQAHCCQFLNMGEKINTRATKIALVKYTEKVKELLGIETTVISGR